MDHLYVVVTIQPDGTAAVTTPVPAPGQSSGVAASQLAAQLGGYIVPTAVVEAITKSVAPPASSLVHPDTFRERLMPAYLRVAAADAALAAKWDRIIRDYLPPTRTAPVNLTSSATTALVGALAADGLLTAGEAAAALAVS